MNLKDKFKTLKFQEGGVAPEQGVPPEQGAPQEDPQAQLMQAIDQALQTQDCELAFQVLQAIQEQLGGGQPAPEAPVFLDGGNLKRKSKHKMPYLKNGKMKLKAKKGKLIK